MPDSDLAIVPGPVVRKLLEGQEELVLGAVREAYLAHGAGLTRTPSTKPLYTGGGRFFAMPASIEDARPLVGVKWVASFVANLAAGGERASAMLMVNDAATGRPVAIVDGTLISAKRTAAGAALALRCIADGTPPRSMALVGCGPINYEVLRFTAHLFPSLQHVQLVDLQSSRADAFAARVRAELPAITPAAATLANALEQADVVSFATNATTPYVEELPARSMTILHVSLRDLAPRIIASAYNIVDDIEHVCSARTSVHLASEETGRRDFIRATIPELLAQSRRYERNGGATIVSPFGMAILDLAVLREVLSRAADDPEVVRVPAFRGTVWA